MKIENIYQAVANEELYQNDHVVIRDGVCMRPRLSELSDNTEPLYAVINAHVNKGDIANLAGDDTVITID